MNGLFDLHFTCRHFVAGPPVNNFHILESKTDATTGAVEGDIATSNDGDFTFALIFWPG